ncbi:MAG: bifunctional 2-methylcitrate dehydratase/aconitate hydratase [Betaproteobacteria bacterium]|nr:bifunctional 2-methylcitrate dehydratase/aconitate hydratase [Betaproteobacteria bacterium]
MTVFTPYRPRPRFDRLLVGIANYAARDSIQDPQAYELARYCLMDGLGCAFQALGTPECTKLLGPVTAGTIVPHGARVPGTPFELDPVKAAFDITCLVRWLDFSDTWLTGGHPSDNLGAVLAVADRVSRMRLAATRKPLLMRDALGALIQAYEIHGRLATHNSLDRPEIGIDGTLLVKASSAAVATRLLGGGKDEILSAVSNAFIDSSSLNLYRKGDTAGSRKSWAAADATSRGVWLALLAMRGEMGYPSALTARTWGFHDALLGGKPLIAPPRYDTHVVRNIQFKVAYPAQRHAQTAAECALRLHPQIRHRLADIRKVVITTHQLARDMISVTGRLPNFAARDHCLQYVVAVALIHGEIRSGSYEDEFAADPRIDALRAKTEVKVDSRYTRGYYDPRRRSNANAVQVFFRDGTATPRVDIEFPLGDPQRRREHLPLIEEKFRRNLALRFAPKRQRAIESLLGEQRLLEATPVPEFMAALVP